MNGGLDHRLNVQIAGRENDHLLAVPTSPCQHGFVGLVVGSAGRTRKGPQRDPPARTIALRGDGPGGWDSLAVDFNRRHPGAKTI